jgi:hypothetical protein
MAIQAKQMDDHYNLLISPTILTSFPPPISLVRRHSSIFLTSIMFVLNFLSFSTALSRLAAIYEICC